MISYIVLDLLDDSPWFLVVPRTALGSRGVVGGPVARPDRSRGRSDLSRGHPALPSSSSTPIPRIPGYQPKSMQNQGILMIFRKFKIFMS